jgi:hypothetical protein
MMDGDVSAHTGQRPVVHPQSDSVISAIERFEGRKYDYRPLNDFERNYMRYPTDIVERIRNDVVMGALRGLSVRLGSLRDGRRRSSSSARA